MLEKALALGMKEEEYHRVVEILGRVPTETELAMYSVEWSEHCGYPRSRALLRLLPRTGKFKTLIGQDAGGIEIAPGLAIVFKMESHNHPSQVEPKQGAATGIGGIVRDIFGSGARPIALLDSLRFGDLRTPLARYLFNGVVDGIQSYGNSIGVPTVGGEVYFNECYRGNCLVGVMCVGVARAEDLISARARGVGNSVIYFGNSTGRDGIGGASILASHELGEDEEKRPTVQIGDPFTEKCLIEATLEMLRTGAVVSLKDMGAAGLTCSTCEQAAAGEVGMEIDLDQVPLREADMEPWEIMMSESQERMLAVVEKGREEEVLSICRRWDLGAAVIGQVTGDGMMRVRHRGKVVAEMPAKSLAEAPLYHLPAEEPAYIKQVRSFDPSQLPEPSDYNDVLLKLLASPNIASKEWVFHQYDHTVQTNTVVAPGKGDAAVLRLKFSDQFSVASNQSRLTPHASRLGIAAVTDCNARYCYLDPCLGAQIAVAEAARNLVCVGAEPAAVTDCLCFGNPEKPERFWQFKRAVEGIATACEFFDLPVVSGNVSFYNETPASVIHPSPLIGMIGVLSDVTQHLTLGFKREGDIIALVGETGDDLGGTEYLHVIHGLEVGAPPSLDFERERAVQRTVLEAAQKGLLSSAHDCSEGGLAVALAECCIEGGIGAAVELRKRQDTSRNDALLFGESQSRIIVSLPEQRVNDLLNIAQQHGAPVTMLGKVGGQRLRVNDLIDVDVSALDRAWRGAIPCLMNA
ncbi:MAG: phosphoribosylformylglycinamidine synthase subunit PurL [Abditibacteriales bacterium]|nr:phosphoribosylformylglycinamidine synthase subunit PurL [Abditibacteriales bacterium]MDW8365120.1 phosphoribosylformylglycinamidine synthase subunit PurL [Abditibacteriales bacterium]